MKVIKFIIVIALIFILGCGFWAFGLETSDQKEIKEFINKKYLNK